MKKILLFSFIYLLGNIGFSQIDNSENNAKNIRFGLKANLSIDWMKAENQKKFTSDGSGLGLGWGAQLEYRLNKTLSVVTGFGLQTAKGKIDYLGGTSSDSLYYILNKDEEFQTFDTANFTGNEVYLLRNRSYKINYITIPVLLKMKTKEIGYFTYYGQFGLNLGFKTKAKVTDNVSSTTSNTDSEVEIKDLDLNSGASFARAGLIVGGGAEYNISGSTAIFFDLTYNYFFSNAVSKSDKYLGAYDIDESTLYKKVNQKFIPGSVALTVGILF